MPFAAAHKLEQYRELIVGSFSVSPYRSIFEILSHINPACVPTSTSGSRHHARRIVLPR